MNGKNKVFEPKGQKRNGSELFVVTEFLSRSGNPV